MTGHQLRVRSDEDIAKHGDAEGVEGERVEARGSKYGADAEKGEGEDDAVAHAQPRRDVDR